MLMIMSSGSGSGVGSGVGDGVGLGVGAGVGDGIGSGSIKTSGVFISAGEGDSDMLCPPEATGVGSGAIFRLIKPDMMKYHGIRAIAITDANSIILARVLPFFTFILPYDAVTTRK